MHVAYEGPYPWDDGARMKAIAGVEGWGILIGPRPAKDEDLLQGALVSDWDFSTGTFIGKRPAPPEPSEKEKLQSELANLRAVMASSDWYAARQAKTGIPIPKEVLSEYLEALEKYNVLELKLKSLEDHHVD